MKIGVVGNTNNYPYMLTQGLKSVGHEAYLIITSKELLNRPENRNEAFSSNYPEWIKDYSHIDVKDYYSQSSSIRDLANYLETMDALVLNHIGPSLLPMLKEKKPAISFLTGSDLTFYANPCLYDFVSANYDSGYKFSPRGILERQQVKAFGRRQAKGISNSLIVSYFPGGIDPQADRILKEIGAFDLRHMMIYMAGMDIIKYAPPPVNKIPRIFCATRLNWKLPIEKERNGLDYKGSDIMVKGIALFYKRTGIKLDVHLVRKGFHVKETEDLVGECGITELVSWHNEMSLEEVWRQFALSDIVVEQLGETSYIGMAGVDAMATGRPVIGNYRPEVAFIQLPISQARTPDEVADHLKRLVKNPEERLKAGKINRKFAEEYLAPEIYAKKCVEIFTEYMNTPKSIKMIESIYKNFKRLFRICAE